MGKTKTKSRSVGDSPKPPITIRSTNVKILDDNIAKLEKAIQAGDVSANPSGTAEETLLSTIGIDGKKYELGPSAENTSYDNTDSGLTATDTQAAIDEIAPALTAEGTSYDNTDSGLTATDTQEAIDELLVKFIPLSKIIEGNDIEFGTFNLTYSEQTFPVTGIKVTTTNNNRYCIIGMVLSGSVKGNHFIAYTSWAGALIDLTAS